MIQRISRFHYFLLMVVTIFVYSCKSGHEAATNTTSKKSALTQEQQSNLMYNFVNANKEKMLGNENRAMDLFAQCLKIDPKNDAAAYELAQLYANKKRYNDAINFARTAYHVNPTNEWYKLLLAELYQRTTKWNDAVTIYESLVNDNPTRIDYYFQWAQALLFAGKANEAIKVYDKIETEIGMDKEVSIQKERLYIKEGKIDKAAEELDRYITRNTNDMEMYSLLYDLYSVNNMPEKALEVIDRMKKVNPNEPRIYLSLADYYRSKGDKEKSFENLKLAFGNKELDSDVKVKIISSYLPLVQQDSTMMKQGTELCEVLAETHPTESRAQAIYGDFLTMNKKYSESVIYYRKALDLEKKNVNVWQQYIINESELKNFSIMDSASTEAMTYFPNESSLYLLNGIAKTQLEKHDDAIKILLQGYKLVVDNDQQLLQFYTNLGDNYNKVKNYTESDKYFDKALDIDPKEAFVLNNYAYYLSLRNEKLEKAESMSKLSNELQPNQSSFLDTYGWILFMEAKYSDAKTWLEKAMQNGGETSGTILEHYGDVLYKLNDTPKAIEFWNKAKTVGGASDLIDKKINDKKYYE